MYTEQIQSDKATVSTKNTLLLQHYNLETYPLDLLLSLL